MTTAHTMVTARNKAEESRRRAARNEAEICANMLAEMLAHCPEAPARGTFFAFTLAAGGRWWPCRVAPERGAALEKSFSAEEEGVQCELPLANPVRAEDPGDRAAADSLVARLKGLGYAGAAWMRVRVPSVERCVVVVRVST